MRIRSIFAVAGAVALATAAVAIAAPTPDQTVTLSAASPEFSWAGTQGQHFDPQYDVADCSKDATNFCDVFLLDVQSGGPVTLDASLTDFSNPVADFDLRVYENDAEAGGPGEQVPSPDFTEDPAGPSWGGPNGVEEFFHAENLPPGKYWLVAHHYFNPNATYAGNVKVTGATPTGGGTPPGGTPTPPPGSGPASLPFKVAGTLGSAKKANKRKSLSFKATADRDITDLAVSLLNSRKKVVGRARYASFAQGSRTIKLKVKKLKAGRYQIAAEGVVDGAKQGIVQAVRIRR